MPTYPERIVYLTEETTETLYLLGEGTVWPAYRVEWNSPLTPGVDVS